MDSGTKQIVIAAAAAGTAALVSALVTHYLTKKDTVEKVAQGTLPLPQGSTPTTQVQSGPPTPVTPTASPAPAPDTQTELQNAAAIAQAAGEQLGWIAASWKSMGYNKPNLSPEA